MGILDFFFKPRRSGFRAGVFGGFAAFFIAWGSFYYNNRHAPPWIAVLLIFIGGIFVAFTARQMLINNGKSDRLARNCALGVSTGVVVLAALDLYFEYRPQPSDRATFSVACMTRLVGSRDSSLFWWVRTGRDGVPEGLPVAESMFVRLTNLRPFPLMVESYSVETADATGKWERAVSLPVSVEDESKVYAVGDGFHKAVRLDFVSLSDVTRNKNLAPGETIHGWLFFAGSTNNFGRVWRFRLRDASGMEYIQPLLMNTTPSEPDSIEVQSARVKPTTSVDISNMRRIVLTR